MAPETQALAAPPTAEELFDRVLSAHLPAERFARLQRASVLVAGLGGGSNIAELLVRKGVGRLTIADPDIFEPHNIRQRGSAAGTWGRSKVAAMADRLRDINPRVGVAGVEEGVTLANVEALVAACDVVLDMLDFHALREKVALYQVARRLGRTVVTTPSVVNGAVLFVFAPDGPAYEEFFGLDPRRSPAEQALAFLSRLIPDFPPEAPRALYEAAARGERTIPLDAVGVDQAAVMAVAAIENLLLERTERVVFAPRAIRVDVSDPTRLAAIVEPTRACRAAGGSAA